MPSSGYLAKPSLPSSGEIHTEIAPQDRTNRTEIAPQDRTDLSLSWSGATVLCWYWSISHSLFFSQFDRIWWIFVGWVLFLLYLSIEKWYYIFVWKLRKCEKMWETSRKCVFYIIFRNTTKRLKIFSKAFFGMQPNTWKYFPFRKIAFLKNIYFPENILHEPNTALAEIEIFLLKV